MAACWRGLALAVLTCLGLAQAHSSALRLEIAAVGHADFQLQGVLLIVAADGASADLRIDRLSAGGRDWRSVRVTCPKLVFAYPGLHCEDGRLVADSLGEEIRVAFDFDLQSREGGIDLRSGAGERLALHLEQGTLSGRITGLNLARLGGWMPVLAAYAPGGRFDGKVSFDGQSALALNGTVSAGTFASSDDLQAGEGLLLDVEARLRTAGDKQLFSATLNWKRGEAYIHPVYLTAPVGLVVAGELRSDRVELTRATLEIDGAEALEGRATLSLPDGAPRRLTVAISSADLGVLGPRFIAPVVAPARATSLDFDGRLSAGLVFEQGELQSVDAVLDQVRYEDADIELAFGPLSGVLPWRAAETGQASLHVGGGRWQALELGAFELKAELKGDGVVIPHLEVPLLDGRLLLSDLDLRHSETGWSGSGSAVVEPISMPLLSAALGLPEMAGVLSASMPRLRVSPGELALDGALVVSVFDGYLRVTELTAIEPFGVSSRLFSNLTARNIDLTQLTEALSFGGMSGFIDVDIDGLELAHWRPVRFDARVASSPGRYPKRISQRAVENISALAGPGAGLALQRGFLRFFDDFGYREIGLSCRLDGGVCIMGGIPPDASDSFEIVRGGGIPALNVIGYNRRVDWDELVDRVLRVIESNTAPVIR